MHLERIELTNYCQHREMDVEFEGNMVALVAGNGAGKSNFLGAIQFALTGEHPGANKADLARWGTKEGSVRLTFTAGPKNERFVVTRKTTGDVVLHAGAETVKSPRKVEDFLKEKAGIDRELVRQIVFVSQGDVNAILFDDPRKRELAFHRLIGIGEASKIYEALRPEISAYDKPQGFEEAIGKARSRLAEQRGAAETFRGALARYDEAMKAIPSKEFLEGEVDRLAGAQAAAEEYLSVSGRLSDAQSANEAALKRLGEAGSIPEGEEDDLRTRVGELENSFRFLSRLKELSDAASGAAAEHEKALRESEEVRAKYPGGLAEERERVKRLDSEQSAAEAEARSLRSMMREASSDGTCPLCGAPATQDDISRHVSEKLEALEARRAEATGKAAEARMALDRREAEEASASRREESARARREAAEAALRNARDKGVDGVFVDMKTFEVSYMGASPGDLPNIERSLAEKRARLAAAVSAREAAKEARDEAARRAAQVEMLAQSREAAAKRLLGMGIDPETLDEGSFEKCRGAAAKARRDLDAYNGILRDMAAEKARLESAEKAIGDAERFVDELVEKKEAEDSVRGRVDTLKRVRDWFHYANGPRIMSQNIMGMLTAGVNDYLAQFCAPFAVEAEEEGFGFRYRMIDGSFTPTPHPDASRLSGGQKVALAIAFRLAIYMCFGGELGLLSLDEPTAYLDDASIDHLGELLQKVGEIARNKGLQILMATHEKAIMPFLDAKIDIGALKR